MIGHPRLHAASRWRRLPTIVLAASAVIAASCKQATPEPAPRPIVQMVTVPPPPPSPWPGTLATALRAAESGRFSEAERILTDFGLAHKETPEGAESDFWRALLKTDPANRAVTPRESMALYDSYLSGGTDQPRYAEALILRRVVESMDSTRALLTTVRASAEARDKSRDEEIRRLNDVIDRTTAELDRIKRRLIPKP